MRKTRYRYFIVALWLMTFLGQALASASLCCEDLAFSSELEQHTFDASTFVDTSNEFLVLNEPMISYEPLISNELLLNQPSLIEPAAIKAMAMDHRQHQQSSSSSNPQSFFDSDTAAECISNCDCLMGGCAAAALSETQTGFKIDVDLPTSAYTSLPQDHLITSLFRPPIFR